MCLLWRCQCGSCVSAVNDWPCLADAILWPTPSKRWLPRPRGDTYLPPSLVVVPVHCRQPAPILARYVPHGHIQEPPAEWHPVVDVIWAAAPMPALAGWAAALQAGVTGALGHVARTAGPCHGVHQARRRHRMYERRLLRACKATQGHVASQPPQITFLAKLEKWILLARVLLKGKGYEFKVVTAWSALWTCLKL